MTAGQRLRAERLRGGCDGGTKTDPSGLQKGPAYQAREDIPAETQQDLPEQDCAAGDPGFCWKGRGRQQVTWAERLSGDTSPAPPPTGKTAQRLLQNKEVGEDNFRAPTVRLHPPKSNRWDGLRSARHRKGFWGWRGESN